MAGSRQYDIILWGATGYTGQYTAEHITSALPTNIKWAIAGRSQSKLEAQLQDLKKLNPDRALPSIEIAQLQKEDLHALARKTKLIINTVGPYLKYGEPVVEACATEGTHYVDVTGETVWTRDMTRKYDSVAKKNGAIIIPQTGVESAPADLMAFVLAKHVRTATSFGTREVVHTIYSAKGGLSGGTLATVLHMFENYSLLEIDKGFKPDAMLSGPMPRKTYSPSLFTRLLGARNVPDLGTLTTSPPGAADVPIIYRSWELFKNTSEAYGDSFSFHPYLTVRNTFLAALVHIGGAIGPLFLALSPVRWLLSKVVTPPGQGPTREAAARESIEWRSMAYPDGPSRDKAYGRLFFEGGVYYLTGILLAEAAATILLSEDVPAKGLGGGVLTPATLGQAYVDRLDKSGVSFQVRTMTQ